MRGGKWSHTEDTEYTEFLHGFAGIFFEPLMARIFTNAMRSGQDFPYCFYITNACLRGENSIDDKMYHADYAKARKFICTRNALNDTEFCSAGFCESLCRLRETIPLRMVLCVP
jgi:ribonucleotide reductase alpha subunit